MQEVAIVAGVFGGIFGLIAAAFVCSVFFGALGIWIGGKIVSAPSGSFPNSLIASLGSSIASFALGLVLGVVPVIGNMLGYALGLIASVFIVQGLFETDGLKSCVCVAMGMVASWVGLVMTVVVAGGGLAVMGVILGQILS